MTDRSTRQRLAYDDPDTATQMASDASACRSETHLSGALGTLLQVPRVVTRTATRTVVTVTEQAAGFAARLLD
jgi:hypothetical protein